MAAFQPAAIAHAFTRRLFPQPPPVPAMPTAEQVVAASDYAKGIKRARTCDSLVVTAEEVAAAIRYKYETVFQVFGGPAIATVVATAVDDAVASAVEDAVASAVEDAVASAVDDAVESAIEETVEDVVADAVARAVAKKEAAKPIAKPIARPSVIPSWREIHVEAYQSDEYDESEVQFPEACAIPSFKPPVNNLNTAYVYAPPANWAEGGLPAPAALTAAYFERIHNDVDTALPTSIDRHNASLIFEEIGKFYGFPAQGARSFPRNGREDDRAGYILDFLSW